MLQLVLSLLAALTSALKSRRTLVLENLALRHQLGVLTRSTRRSRLRLCDRLLWIVLRWLWADWKEALVLVQPATVVRYQVLFCFLILAHDRRRVLHFNVTDHPTAAWTAQQMLEAFPWDTAPRYLLRDRDTIHGAAFRQRLAGLGVTEVLTAPHAPWQSPYVERLIGSIRRECLDHVIVLNAAHLRRTLTRYLRYYHRTRTHLSLEKDAPQPRPVNPPTHGPIVEIPDVGGLHHRYERRAAGRPVTGAHLTPGSGTIDRHPRSFHVNDTLHGSVGLLDGDPRRTQRLSPRLPQCPNLTQAAGAATASTAGCRRPDGFWRRTGGSPSGPFAAERGQGGATRLLF